MKGKLLVISGPSGAGKGTVLKKLFEMRNDVYMSISATSRKPRVGEEDGVNYFFVSTERFREMIEAGELLEHAEFCGNFYGTPSSYVDKMLSEGNNVILEIEVCGAMQVKQKRPDAVLIFILPPSIEELHARLSGRGTESAEVIEERMNAARRELDFSSKYDYKVVNDEVERAAEEISQIIEKTMHHA